MQRGGDIDVCREAVIGHRQAAVPGQRGDLHRFGEAAAAREIHLHDVDAASVHQVEKRLPVALFLSGGDADRRGFRQLPIAFVVVGPQRLFQPEDVVLGEVVRALQCGLRIPHQAGIDQQIGFVAEALSASRTSADRFLDPVPSGPSRTSRR